MKVIWQKKTKQQTLIGQREVLQADCLQRSSFMWVYAPPVPMGGSHAQGFIWGIVMLC